MNEKTTRPKREKTGEASVPRPFRLPVSIDERLTLYSEAQKISRNHAAVKLLEIGLNVARVK